jgi:hypothetical protein
MKILGTMFIIVGVLMMFTWILMLPGLGCVGVGALLRIAGRKATA